MAASKATGPSKTKAKTQVSVLKGAKKGKLAVKSKKVAKTDVAAKKKASMTNVSQKAKVVKPITKVADKTKPVAKAKPVSHRQADKTPAKASVASQAAASRPVKVAVAKPALAAKPITPATPAKPVAQKAIASVAPVVAVSPVAAQPVQRPLAAMSSMPTKAITPKAVVAEGISQAAKKQHAQKQANVRNGFKTNEFIVYPAHGVGRIVAIEEQEIAGIKLELFVIQFEKDKMTLRVPTGKCQSVGMRKLAEDVIVKRAMETLKGRARIKRTMWSRRAQEYEAKINSGDIVAIAEVVRDLYRAENQPEQSYSERQLYEAALDRMAREIAAVDKIDERSAVQKIVEVLSRSAKARKPVGEEAVADAGDVKAA